jgi:hypothetical protein
MRTRATSDEILLRRLAESDDEKATLLMFVRLCRESPELRHWLLEDFARDAKVRSKFIQVMADASFSPVGRFLELTNYAGSWLEERRRLREQTPVKLYGGLTWNQVTQLIRRYQAGPVDPGVYLLAHDWRKTGKSSPLMKLAGIEFLELVMFSGRERLLIHLNKAISFLKRYENKAEQRVALGYVNRWKLQVLLYILQHPSEFYLTRELCAYLATRGMRIDARDMRRFCKRHGIKRDPQAGRPRTRRGTLTAAKIPERRPISPAARLPNRN